MKYKKLPKPKPGAWYVKVRGSYLPCSWQGWAMHGVLVALAIGVFFVARENNKNIFAIALSSLVDLYVLGSIFTWIAAKKS